LCFIISRNFSFRFFNVSVFLCIFSLHDHDCSISHLHSNAFHTLSYFSCNKNHKILVQNKDSKQGEFQVSCTKSSFLYSLCMSQPEETWVKKIYNYLKTFRFSVFAPSLYCLMDSSRGEMGIFNPYSSDRNFSKVKQRRLWWLNLWHMGERQGSYNVLVWIISQKINLEYWEGNARIMPKWVLMEI